MAWYVWRIWSTSGSADLPLVQPSYKPLMCDHAPNSCSQKFDASCFLVFFMDDISKEGAARIKIYRVVMSFPNPPPPPLTPPRITNQKNRSLKLEHETGQPPMVFFMAFQGTRVGFLSRSPAWREKDWCHYVISSWRSRLVFVQWRDSDRSGKDGRVRERSGHRWEV